MKSRVPPKYKTKYRVTNWADYDKGLVQRGDITLWITPDVIKAWTAKPTGRRGAPRKYSDLAIETVLTLRLIFHLPLRQSEGFLRSMLELMGLSLETPDHTTLSRRSTVLEVDLRVLRTKKPMHLIIDSAGLSIVGEGEWASTKHGGRGRRGWRKLHIGVDGSGVIQTEVLTKSNSDDANTGIDIIGATQGKLSRVTGDAAYDTVGFYRAASSRVWSSLQLQGRQPLAVSRGRQRGTKRFARWRSLDAGNGRSGQATTVRGSLRTRSFATRRSWAIGFTPEVCLHRKLRSRSDARSSIGC